MFLFAAWNFSILLLDVLKLLIRLNYRQRFYTSLRLIIHILYTAIQILDVDKRIAVKWRKFTKETHGDIFGWNF